MFAAPRDGLGLHAEIDECFLCPPLRPVIPPSARAPGFSLPLAVRYLTAPKRQHFLSTSCFSSPPLVVLCFFLKANTAASGERRTSPIPRASSAFSPGFARQETQLSLHMNPRSRHREGTIRNLLPDGNIARLWWGGVAARVVRAPTACQLPPGFLCLARP